MNRERMYLWIRRNTVSIALLIFIQTSIAYVLLIIPGIYYYSGIALLSLPFLGLFLISESNHSGSKRYQKQRRLSYIILVLFILFIITSTGAAYRFGIDQALRPAVTYNDSETPLVLQEQYLPANDTEISNSTNDSNGTLYIVNLYEIIGISDTVNTATNFSLTLGEIISFSDSVTLDANDEIYGMMNEASTALHKQFHSSSKWLKKKIFRRIRRKSKKLKRLELSKDRNATLTEYQKLLDEAVLLEKVLF